MRIRLYIKQCLYAARHLGRAADFRMWVALVAAFSCLFTVVSCRDDNSPAATGGTEWRKATVAVVLPLDEGMEGHWKRVLELCAANLHYAFDGRSVGIDLAFEWYDEESESLPDLAKDLAARDDLLAVIGGRYSASAAVMEAKLCKTGKPFFTLATNGELVRAYASVGNLWAMTETDITQCEVLLSKALYYGAKRVALIAKDDIYGKTFVDWFAFQAEGLGLEAGSIVTYTDGTLEGKAREAALLDVDFVVCAPSSVQDVKVILEAFQQVAVEGGTPPRTLFSDIAYGSEALLSMGYAAEGLEGVAFGSDPMTGFDVYMDELHKDHIVAGEAQVYDAAMLVGLAAYKQACGDGEVEFTEVLRRLVDGRDKANAGWMKENIRDVVDAMDAGRNPDLHGASGRLDFDAKVYTNVLHTVYHNYKIYNGRYITLDYNTSDGTKRSDATLAGWNWRATQMQEFESQGGSEIKYPSLDQRWALLVAGSSGWNNYRHQADVLNMYHILKNNGYDDDHIVLVMEDDIAYNAKNPAPGTVQVRPGGKNVHEGIEIDYRTSQLSPDDIGRILCGKRDTRLEQVIEADYDDNVLVFWSGHGIYRQLSWLDARRGFTAEFASDVFRTMHEERRYRKLLLMIEACYSGSVAEACEGVPGLLALTATNDMEPSKADVYNYELGVWMSNRFTSTLQECLATDPTMSMRDLYYRLFINTVGSHVMVYNAGNYGNMYQETMAEYLH